MSCTSPLISSPSGRTVRHTVSSNSTVNACDTGTGRYPDVPMLMSAI